MKLERGTPLILIAQTVWGLMFFTPVILFFILYSQYGMGSGVLIQEDFVEPQVLMLAILALANASMSWFFPAFILRSVAKKMPAAESERELLKRSFPPYVVSLALAEAVSVMGFVASHMTEKTIVMVPFVLLMAVIFLARFPTYALFRNWHRKL